MAVTLDRDRLEGELVRRRNAFLTREAIERALHRELEDLLTRWLAARQAREDAARHLELVVTTLLQPEP
jgi:hypothetical protein